MEASGTLIVSPLVRKPPYADEDEIIRLSCQLRPPTFDGYHASPFYRNLGVGLLHHCDDAVDRLGLAWGLKALE